MCKSRSVYRKPICKTRMNIIRMQMVIEEKKRLVATKIITKLAEVKNNIKRILTKE